MDEILKKIFQDIQNGDVDVKVVKVDKSNKDDYAEAMQDAKEIAKYNKILFDAHVAEGFTADQAIQIVAAAMTNVN